MSDLTILCEVDLSPHDRAVLDRVARERKTTRERVIRDAVARFSEACVPTHRRRLTRCAK